MKDGLYQITLKNICAGFVIKDGIVIMCAPILRNMIKWYPEQWFKRARLLPSRTDHP